MNAHHVPEKPEPPLRIDTVEVMHCRNSVVLTFNRPPDDKELEAYEKLPPTPQMYVDTKSYIERMMLAELVVRLFRFYVLGNIVLPDTPLAMDWLKSFVDGNNGHGPLGSGPLRWPTLVPSACNVLTRWGFVPTDTMPQFVGKAPPEKPDGHG